MQLLIYGNSDKQLLDIAARSVYMLSNDEYRVIPSETSEREYVMEANTPRHIDPMVRSNAAPGLVTATVSLYPGINSVAELTIDDVLEVLMERYKISRQYINIALIEKSMPPIKAGFIVLDIPAIKSIPVVNGRDAVVQNFFELPSTKPKIMPNGRVDYKEFTKFVFVKANDLLVKRVPPTPGARGFDITGAEIFPVPGKDKTVNVLEGVLVNPEETEYRAKYNGHIVHSGNAITVLPLLMVSGDVDLKVGNIRFNGAVQVIRNVLTGFSIESEDIIIDGIDEDAVLIASNNVIIKTGIKGLGNKGYIKAGNDAIIGYSENAAIQAGNSIEIKKYCFNSSLSANKIFTSSSDAIVTGGTLRAFSEIRLANAGSKGTNDMTLSVGISPILDGKAKKVKEEIDNLNASLEKIMQVLSKLDLKNPAVLSNIKVRKLLETVSILKRKLPLLTAKHTDLQAKSKCDKPRIIIERMIRASVKIQMYDITIELKADMSKVEFFFVHKTREISFKPYVPDAK